MKAKKIIINILIILGFSLSGMAQFKGPSGEDLSQNSNRLQGKLTGTVYNITPEANANFFLHEKWNDGIITLEDNDIFTGLKMRYYAYGDELVVYNEKIRSLFIVDKNKVNEFRLVTSEKEMHFIKLDFEGYSSNQRYFELIYQGVNKLVAFHFVEAFKVSPYSDRHGIMRDTEYRKSINYFMYSENEGFFKLQMRRRSILKIFPDNKKEIRKLFRKNNLIINNESSMIRAFTLLEENEIIKRP